MLGGAPQTFAMSRSPTLLARALEPLIGALWIFFLVWSAVVAALWLSGDEAIARIGSQDLRHAATLVAKASDTFWLLLAAANLYLQLATEHGLRRARFIAFGIAAVAAALAASSAAIGDPLGSVFYTTRLGVKLGAVPLGWPLLWLIVVIGGRELAARVFPRASHGALALITGGVAVLTDLNLESIATKLRFFWFWYVAGTHQPSAPPWTNFLVWFAAASGLACLLREEKVEVTRLAFGRPAAILLVFNFLLVLGHLRLALDR